MVRAVTAQIAAKTSAPAISMSFRTSMAINYPWSIGSIGHEQSCN
jgi:hypothetical protein